MVIWTGEEAEDKMEKLQWAEAVPGYYDYTESMPNNQGTTSVVIRQSDKKCLFLNSKRHYGSIVIDGTIEEFKTIIGINLEDIREMIKCAKELPSLR